MTEEQTTIIDYIDKYEIKGDVFNSPSNEYWALKCLEAGIKLISNTSVEFDLAARKKVNPRGTLRMFFAGTAVHSTEVRLDHLTCFYHWYSISACQYVRTVGSIALREGLTEEKPSKYVERVIPEVLAFRDKVAAHFAYFSRNKQDNDAERLASILPPITYEDTEFRVGSFLFTMGKNGKKVNSEALSPWNIRRVHDRLTKRYWPK